MGNPWLAINLSEDPRSHAHALQRAWESYLSSGTVHSVVRPVVMQSWKRSAIGGVRPEKHLAPIIYDPAETRERWREHPLARVLPVVRELLSWVAEEAEHLVVVSDVDGHLLWIEGNSKARSQAEEMQFVLGARWSEQAAGTNAIGTALAFDHPIQIFAAEHFSQLVHSWTCSAAPVHDPATGKVLGVIDITGKLQTGHPHSLALVTAAALAAEAALQYLPTGTNTSYSSDSQPVMRLNVLGRDQVSTQIAGQQFCFSQRHSEILTLLARHPEGLSSDKLSLRLYGDLGNPITVRAEMSRLRKILGTWLDTHSYRLALPVEADFILLERLLKQGKIHQALELYRGPLLPSSGAPGIVEIREQLEVWLRRSILASREPELLWRWVEISSGQDDLESWEILLDCLDRQDPLLGKVLARVFQLQQIYFPNMRHPEFAKR